MFLLMFCFIWASEASAAIITTTASNGNHHAKTVHLGKTQQSNLIHTGIRSDMNPFIGRATRSVGSMESPLKLGSILPVWQALQRQRPPAAARADGPPIPPPPPDNQDRADDADPAAQSLAALLKYLLTSALLDGIPGAGFGRRTDSSESSEEGYGNGFGNSLLPFLALTGALNEPAALIARPGAVREKMGKLHLGAGAKSAKVTDGTTTTKRKLVSLSQLQPTMAEDCAVLAPRSSVCDNQSVDKILTLKHAVVVVKGRNIYRVRANGEPFDLSPKILDKKFDLITATATIGRAQYIFQADQFTKFDLEFKPASGVYPKNVSDEFPGVIVPVDGVFQLNSHTHVFISGGRYVYFQPDANPKVDPRYSPQYLDSVPGAPSKINSAFVLKGRKFLHKHGTIFELAPNDFKVIREIPVMSNLTEGWLKCPESLHTASSGCAVRQVKDGHVSTTATYALPLP